MKILAKVVIAISTIILCSGVQAAPSFDLPLLNQSSVDNYTTLSTQSRSGWRSWRIWRWWRSYRPHQPRPNTNPRAVPELDAAIAPLAVMLLGGLVAAGVERRRRKAK